MTDPMGLMAMLLSSEPPRLTPRDVLERFQQALPSAEIEAPVSTAPGTPFVFTAHGATHVWRPIDAPTPPGHLDRAIARSVSLPEARIYAAAAVTRFAAVVLNDVSALGVHGSASDVVARPDRLAAAPKGLGERLPPVDHWVGFELFRNDEGAVADSDVFQKGEGRRYRATLETTRDGRPLAQLRREDG